MASAAKVAFFDVGKTGAEYLSIPGANNGAPFLDNILDSILFVFFP